MIVKLYACYSFINFLQVIVGILSSYMTKSGEDENEFGLLTPFWVVLLMFGVGLSFLSVISFLGFINLALMGMREAIAQYNVTIRLMRGECRAAGSPERKDELDSMGDILSSLLTLECNVANFLGLPINTKLLSLFWSNGCFVAFVVFQFVFFRNAA